MAELWFYTLQMISSKGQNKISQKMKNVV